MMLVERIRALAFGSALVATACASAPGVTAEQLIDDQAGALIIVGGGLKSDTEDVWQSFISEAIPDKPIIIVPSASGSPVQSAGSAEETLIKYGVTPDRVKVAKLATEDDRSTNRVNEARWAKNINDPETLSLLETAGAIWFTGGDQSRTTSLFLDDDAPTALLAAVKQARAAGAPIGGTSAGAAIMSSPMITQGETLAALTGSTAGEALGLADGLGFFSAGIVDQHFGERARLGRLVAALEKLPDPERRLGFGVDEDTALIVEADGDMRVEGAAYVTIIDARAARFTQLQGGALQVTGLTLHMLSAGDQVDGGTLAQRPASWKSPTVGDEYVEVALPGGGGMALSGQTLQNVLGEGLVDNAASTSVERVSFDGSGRGVAYVFTQLPDSKGYWGRGPSGEGRYAIANVRFDILPIRIGVETLK